MIGKLNQRLTLLLGILGVHSAIPCLTADDSSLVPGYPADIKAIHYPVEEDQSQQPALFWKPKNPERPTPLLVALHTWSNDYLQAGGEAQYAKWCLENDWVFIHPNFRGRNRMPESMGSDLAVADIRAAVEWAKSEASIDETRIYAIGVSGGGHMTQLLAGRTPEIWAGISSWCGISDIAAWHQETIAAGRGNYAKDIEGALGGSPTKDPEILKEALHRSPLSWLKNASDVPLDINHGIDDGRTGSVPFTHSLNAWNVIVPESSRLESSYIRNFYETQEIPSGDKTLLKDPFYGSRQPVFRRTHENTRLTLFKGGHEIVHDAALHWLAAQQKGKPAQWSPPRILDWELSDHDAQSGK